MANETRLKDFIKYCKKEFGISISLKKSDRPDTFESLFGKINKEEKSNANRSKR